MITRTMLPQDIRHVRPVRPIAYPASDPEWEMPESSRHMRLCEVVYQILKAAAGAGCTVGSDQFIYFDASNPRRKCAPDGFVKLGCPAHDITSFKAWKHGAPELCIEILSSDTEEKITLTEKLVRFHAMGVEEVVCFDVDAEVGKRLRAWDFVSGDLVERIVTGDRTPCLTLGKWWLIAPCDDEDLHAALRLAEDERGANLVLTPLENERLLRHEEKRQREEAEARIASLERELRRVRG